MHVFSLEAIIYDLYDIVLYKSPVDCGHIRSIGLSPMVASLFK